MDEFSFIEVWGRVALLTNWQSQTQLAEFLGFSSSSISGAKKRGFFPIEWAYRIAKGHAGSTDWLLTGDGPMRKGDTALTAQKTAHTKPAITDDIQSAPYAAFDALEVVEGMGMLTKIYGSGDTTYIRAINANLMAFSRSIDLEKSNKDMQLEINDLKTRLADLEEKFNKLLEVRQKVVNGS